jgi:hypothetical protein
MSRIALLERGLWFECIFEIDSCEAEFPFGYLRYRKGAGLW